MTIQERLLRAKRALFDKAYGFLNDRQREAVFTTEGPLLVLAGAGSGKTTVLVQRIAYLVRYGNAYYSDAVPEHLLSEPYVAKLESLAGQDEAPRDLLDSALLTLANEPVRPYQILAITFTNKAANEIKARLESSLGDAALDVWAGTFHSVCAKLLRMYIDRLGFERSFTIYDTDDQKRLMSAIIKEFEVSDKTFPAKSVLNEISRAKEKLLTPDEYEGTIGTHDLRRRTVLRLYREYESRKRTANALDFDDLILLTVKLFEEDEELLEKYRARFRYILVDEYQDTNKAQFRLTKLLCNRQNNIMVVGDDDQSIYRFRGATIDNILNFDSIFPDTKVIKLEQNYRSSGVIVNAANSVIKNNRGRKGKTLWTGNSEGEKITVRQCDNQNSEAQYIVNKISELVAAGTYNFTDFAVLYRMNAQSNALETVFAKSGIPYRIIGGIRFYERKEIKDVIAYLCVLANPGDSLRLKRIINVPKRGIGDATVAELEQIALAEGKDMLSVAANAAAYPSLSRSAPKLAKFADMMYELRKGYEALPVGVFVEKVIEQTGYLAALATLDEAEAKDRTANVKELVSNAVQYANNTPDATLESFLEEVALVADIDNYDQTAPAVVMMTVHSAKGLEFPVVFLPGMEEGVFPGMQTISAPDDEMEEERRLAYVAITRAKKQLFVLYCRSRMVYGRTEYHQKSRFAEEIPEEYCILEGLSADVTYDRDEYAAARERGISYTDKAVPFKGRSEQHAQAPRARAWEHQTASEVRRQPPAPATVFEVGERVLHPVFGGGLVLGVRHMSGDVLYEVAFDSVGTKKIMGNFAKMTREG
ncbi:MAG: UvrD-helicase domain-containing protein [Eubacteriales bacterium]